MFVNSWLHWPSSFVFREYFVLLLFYLSHTLTTMCILSVGEEIFMLHEFLLALILDMLVVLVFVKILDFMLH